MVRPGVIPRVYPRVCGACAGEPAALSPAIPAVRGSRPGLSPRVRGSRHGLPPGRRLGVYPRVCGGASVKLLTGSITVSIQLSMSKVEFSADRIRLAGDSSMNTG